MAKTTTMANNFLKLLFNATPWANVADNAASSPLTNLYISLLTADPGTTGDQTTNETTYTGYGRQAVARSAGGWTVSGNVASPVANIVFPVSTGGTPTCGFFGIGTVFSGAGVRFYNGTITPAIVVSTSVVQTLTTGSTVTES